LYIFCGCFNLKIWREFSKDVKPNGKIWRTKKALLKEGGTYTGRERSQKKRGVKPKIRKPRKNTWKRVR